MMKAMTLALCLVLSGCVTTDSMKQGAMDATTCTFHTSVSCAIQSLAGCMAPAMDAPSKKWKAYGKCLVDRSKDCSVKGMARCAMVGMMEAFGGPVIAGGAPCDLRQVDLCMSDAEMETKHDAVSAVAHCYRQVCSKGKTYNGNTETILEK